MVCCSKDSAIYAACNCQNMICPIALLAVGIVLGITGCVVAAVGFGKPPVDMFDYTNLAMRITGLVLVGVAILPVAISICCWIFYCSYRREKKNMPDSKKQTYATSVQDQVPLGEYTYSSDSGGNRIYRPQQPPRYTNEDSLAVDYIGNERDESSVPLKFSSASDSFNMDHGSKEQHSMQYHDSNEAGSTSPAVIAAGSLPESHTASKSHRPKKGKKSQRSTTAEEKDTADGAHNSPTRNA